jgi:hypothetical protein
MNSQLSIYIPRMSITHNESTIIQYIENCSIGSVDYIDFTQINKKPGFSENINEKFMSVFIHFSCVYDSTFWTIIQQEQQPYKLQINSREYWLCFKNKNPVQRTFMNVHQIVENGRFLENLIQEQSVEINNLKEIIENQQNKLANIDQIIYQLVGGLFNQNTQTSVISSYLESLNISYHANDSEYNKWGQLPTTRQGDSNEERINQLEKHILPQMTRSSDFNKAE